ncbi:hypothetical protein BpHYR1_005688 [Brachionus plicatilis]|uniref:Uncharacterized protein n=1 Tax=Brachionus plicatilis TaxID=10195 RepID=A0A3M7QUH4_BRAPC|nr:hypothetical protein BpHYR1_005688 [Brachionus plicatilis]
MKETKTDDDVIWRWTGFRNSNSVSQLILQFSAAFFTHIPCSRGHIQAELVKSKVMSNFD